VAESELLGQGPPLVHERLVNQDAEGQHHDHHRGEREGQGDQPLVEGLAPVAVLVGGVQGAAGGGEQVAGHPPGEQQAAQGRAAVLLAELGPQEGVDHPVGHLRADHHPDQRDGSVLAPRDLLWTDEPLDQAQGGADGHGQRHQGQQREERHLGGRAGDPVPRRGAEHVGAELPRVVPEQPLGTPLRPRQESVRESICRGYHRRHPRPDGQAGRCAPLCRRRPGRQWRCLQGRAARLDQARPGSPNGGAQPGRVREAAGTSGRAGPARRGLGDAPPAAGPGRTPDSGRPRPGPDRTPAPRPSARSGRSCRSGRRPLRGSAVSRSARSSSVNHTPAAAAIACHPKVWRRPHRASPCSCAANSGIRCRPAVSDSP
jgi:hypothetical protein